MPGNPNTNPDNHDPEPDPKEPDRSKMNIGLSMGMEMAAGVGLGLLVGYYVDAHFGVKPWGTLVGAMLGLAGGMYLLIKEAMQL